MTFRRSVQLIFLTFMLGTIKHAQLAAIEHNRVSVARLRAQSKLPGKFFYFISYVTRLKFFSVPKAMYQSQYDEYLETSTKEIDALRD